MTNETEQDWTFTRADLLECGDDGRRQAAGWDRLRRVCWELGLRAPTRIEVEKMKDGSDVVALLEHVAGDKNEHLFKAGMVDLAHLLICTRVGDGKVVLLQFAAGYVFGVEEKVNTGATPEGTT